MEYLNMSLLQMYYWVRQWKKCGNRLIFGEVMGKSLVSHGVDVDYVVCFRVKKVSNDFMYNTGTDHQNTNNQRKKALLR